MTDTDFADEATHDAWIVGTHELPIDLQVLGALASDGGVVVRDRNNPEDVTLYSADHFNDEFEWIDNNEA